MYSINCLIYILIFIHIHQSILAVTNSKQGCCILSNWCIWINLSCGLGHAREDSSNCGVRAFGFLRESAGANGRTRLSTKAYRKPVSFLQKSPKTSGCLRECSGECNLGVLYSSSILTCGPGIRNRRPVFARFAPCGAVDLLARDDKLCCGFYCMCV